MDTPWLQSLFEVLDQHMKRGAVQELNAPLIKRNVE
jgi:hypothetical protein